MHNMCYIVITQTLAALPAPTRALFIPYLRGAAFAALAHSLIANDPLPILAAYGIALADPEQRKVAYLATLPELVVTPPEDGDRTAERGEISGGKVKVFEGLVPPRTVWRLGKRRREELRGRVLEELRKVRREEERLRALERRVRVQRRRD
jgi:hypothetical protein